MLSIIKEKFWEFPFYNQSLLEILPNMKIYLSYDLLNTIAAFVWIGTTANIIYKKGYHVSIFFNIAK